LAKSALLSYALDVSYILLPFPVWVQVLYLFFSGFGSFMVQTDAQDVLGFIHQKAHGVNL
jgi:hypothetical protein